MRCLDRTTLHASSLLFPPYPLACISVSTRCAAYEKHSRQPVSGISGLQAFFTLQKNGRKSHLSQGGISGSRYFWNRSLQSLGRPSSTTSWRAPITKELHASKQDSGHTQFDAVCSEMLL